MTHGSGLGWMGYDAVRRMVTADDPRAAREHAGRWVAASHTYAGIGAAASRALHVVVQHLHDRAGNVYEEALQALVVRAERLAECANDNARTWSAIADALELAQRQMHDLGVEPESSSRRAKAIVVQLEKAYRDYYAQLHQPDLSLSAATPAPPAGPGLAGAMRILPLASGLSSRYPGRLPSTKATPLGSDYPLGNVKPVAGTPAPTKWWAGGRHPTHSPPVVVAALPRQALEMPAVVAPPRIKPASAAETVKVSVVPRTPAAPRTTVPFASPTVGLTSLAPEARQSDPPPVSRVPSAASGARLVNRDRLARILAELMNERAALGGVITLRGDEGDTAGVLTAVNRHLRVMGAAADGGPTVLPLRLDVSTSLDAAGVWATLRSLLESVRPKRGLLRFRSRRRKHDADRKAVSEVIGVLTATGQRPVLLVDDLRWAPPAIADGVLDALFHLSNSHAVDAILALDPPTLAASLDGAAGRAAGYGRSRVLRVGSHGADLPPRSAADLARADGPERLPGRSPTTGLGTDQWILDRARRRLLSRPAALRDSERILWLWHFYLMILDIGGLSHRTMDRHSTAVLAVAEAAVCWHDLRLKAQMAGPAAGLASLAEACNDDALWKSEIAARHLDHRHYTTDIVTLRDLLRHDGGEAAALVTQLF